MFDHLHLFKCYIQDMVIGWVSSYMDVTLDLLMFMTAYHLHEFITSKTNCCCNCLFATTHREINIRYISLNCFYSLSFILSLKVLSVTSWLIIMVSLLWLLCQWLPWETIQEDIHLSNKRWKNHLHSCLNEETFSKFPTRWVGQKVHKINH